MKALQTYVTSTRTSCSSVKKMVATLLTLLALGCSTNAMAIDTRVPDCSPDPYGPPATCGNPNVGRIIAKVVGSDEYRGICTASLAYLNDTAVVVTAAHCVEALKFGPYENPMITFDSRAYTTVGGQVLVGPPVILPGDVDLNRYVSISESIEDPRYPQSKNQNDLVAFDLGVLLINEENTAKLKALYPTIQPLQLAPQNYLDRFRTQLSNGDLKITYAGYGHSVESFHGASTHFYYLLSSDGSRRFGTLSYLNHTPQGMIKFQENLNLDNAEIANGDSGSPAILNGMQVGVNSRYLPGIFFLEGRTDTAGALNFFCQYIPNVPCSSGN